MSNSQRSPLRPDIQSLRAVAVLAVIAYHYSIGPFKGGFLGVDIFFVVSGYVITRRLSQYQTGFFATLHDFYLRRAKRLLPSSLLVAATTALFSRIFLPSISLAQIARESLATIFFVPNLFFAHEQNNYLNQGLDPSPYLHYWSLGVEEQFYLLWPLIVLVILRKRIFGVLLTLVLATLGGLLLAHHSPITAFYQPWVRAWEFLAGALLVFAPPIIGASRKMALVLLGWIGIICSLLLISASHPTPGFTTLLPVVATSFVIAGGLNFPRYKALVYIGDISYSLYLVHWPLFIILTSRYQGLNIYERSLIALVAIVIAGLLYRFIENPLRSMKKIVKLRVFALPIIIVAIFSVTILETGAGATSGSVKISREVPILYTDGCHLSFGASQPKADCLFGDPSSTTFVILAGDSHAAMHFPAIDLLARANHWRLFTLTKSSCPAASLKIIRSGLVDSSCVTWEKGLATEFIKYKAKYIFLAGATEQTYSLASDSLSYAAGFAVILQAAQASGATPVLLSDTPYPKIDSPSCILRNSKNLARCDLTPAHSAITQAVLTEAKKYGAVTFSPSDYLCAAGRCPALSNNTNVYRDSSHISIATSLRLEPFIARTLGVKAKP